MKVLIADDHEVARRGLREMLREEFDRLSFGEATDFHEVLDLVGTKEWDLLILDIIMPGPGVVNVITEVRQLRPNLPILTLTGTAEPEYAVSLMKAGANGYVIKDYLSTEFLKAVRKVLKGETYLTSDALNEITASLRTGRPGVIHQRLSPRELEIFQMIATDMAVKEIAGSLNLSEKTVATHVARIKEKTGLMSYVAIARYAILQKLVE